MLTWLLATKNVTRLAATYLVVAAVSFVLAGGAWAVAAAHHAPSSETTLELHITRSRS
jgi:hypothetical protein